MYFKQSIFIKGQDCGTVRNFNELEELDLLLLLDRNSSLEIEFHSQEMNIDSHSQLHKKE